jgi:hypothetical protein
VGRVATTVGDLLTGCARARLLVGNVLLVLLLLATLSASAEARPRMSEAALHSLETRLLGPEHAAEHAAQRAAMRRWQWRRRQMSPAALRRWSGRHTLALGAPAVSPPATVGQWYEPGPGSTPFLLPDYAIHAALLPTGKVILWGYPATPPGGRRPNLGNAWLWDPAAGFGTNSFKQVAPPDASPIYCSGESLLANGNLFIAGGNLGDIQDSKGLNTTFTFDPFTETWHRQGYLRHGRWYPGQVVLPDGRVAILGGYTERGSSQNNTQLEVWPRRDLAPPNDANRSAEALPAERISSGDRSTALYPHLFLTPAGKVLLAGPGNADSALLDPRTFTWRDIGGLPGGLDRIGSNAVLLPGDARVLEIGGYDYPTFLKKKVARARTPTVSVATDGRRGWRKASHQSVGRAYGNTVLLPDKTMVTIGGGAGRATDAMDGTSWTNGDDPALKTVELYDPRTGKWRVGPSERRFRTYHSIALLLPDGSVLSAGDDLHEDRARPDDTWIGSAEIYRPPYLFKGARPTIAAAPAAVTERQAFAVSTPDEESIDHAVLMAPSATTHGADMTQRYVRLRITGRAGGRGVTLAGPANSNVVPPGYYMLFLINAHNVPSVARWVRVLPQARRLSALSITPRAFPAAARAARTTRKTGATIGFRLARPGRVTFSVQRRASGRKRNGHCEAPAPANRGRARCALWVLLRGSFSHAGMAGRNRVRFSGWVGGRALAPRRYRLVATPAGEAAVRTSFRIIG